MLLETYMQEQSVLYNIFVYTLNTLQELFEGKPSITFFSELCHGFERLN